MFISLIPLAGAYSGGNGTFEDPYHITTAKDLLDLGNKPSDYDKHFILMADIDLASRIFKRAVVAPGNVVGSRRRAKYSRHDVDGAKFKGLFDGNGHRIINLTMAGHTCLGLFGALDTGAVIKNLRLEHVQIESMGGRGVGGLVAWNSGAVLNCKSSGAVIGGEFLGGLTGYNDGSISNCYSTSKVTGTTKSGGLVGYNNGAISNCYCTGPTTGDTHVGGLVGISNYGSISNCYSTGQVTGSYMGGLVGITYDTVVSNCFWDMQTSKCLGSDGGTGLTTVDMQDINTYQNAGWDYVDETRNGFCDFWRWKEGNYPILTVFSGMAPVEPQGEGTRASPYIINDVNEFVSIWYRPMAHYCLSTDLELSGIFWNSSVIPYFGGILRGRNYMIDGLYIHGGGDLALFAHVGPDAVISNLGLTGVDVSGTGDRMGSLIGRNFGYIFNCISSGRVNGGNQVGGLIGYNNGSISSCFSSSRLTGTYNVGGLVGNNDGGIYNCYCTGTITGHTYVGGLVGLGYNGSISNCFSIGPVSGHKYVGGLVGTTYDTEVSNCFWDTQTSELLESDGGVGLTTEQMQNIRTYLDAGWDYIDETANGICDFWRYEEGAYPILTGFRDFNPIMPNGAGTLESPYLIDDVNGFASIRFRPMACYRLCADLDLSDVSWSISVIPWFGGILEADGHVIHGLHIWGGGNLALFGLTGPKAEIADLGLAAVDINGTGDYNSGLAGRNYGSIANCYSIAKVTGVLKVSGLVGCNYGKIVDCYTAGEVTGHSVGGLVGYNFGNISQCYSISSITGGHSVGGLVGYTEYGNISNCYSMGSVTGGYYVGGLVGKSYHGRILNCYSAGMVGGDAYIGGLLGSDLYSGGSILNCFWDVQTSRAVNSGGGIGITTTLMQNLNTFLNVGWDFVGEIDNKTDDIWWMPENDYPMLWWQTSIEN